MFYLSRKAWNKCSSYCKACTKSQSAKYRDRDTPEGRGKELDYVRKSRYGLSKAEYEALLTRQGHRCAICGVESPAPFGNFSVDHCHSTGKVRGLLCSKCNLGLGAFRDSADRMRAAIDYLSKAKELQ